MTRKLWKALLVIGLGSGTVFQMGGCGSELLLAGLSGLVSDVADSGIGFGPVASPEPSGWYAPGAGTVDPLGIDVDLPYFDEGDYFEVPAEYWY